MRSWRAIVLVFALSCRAASRSVSPTLSAKWNVWTERYRPSVGFEPLTKLMVKQQYLLVVDLAAIGYGGGPGVYTRGISDQFDDWLARTTEREVGLEVLAIPDDKYFQPQRDAERVKPFRVNVAAMREVRQYGFSLDEPVFDYLKKAPNAPFTFGRVAFAIETKAEPGVASIGLTFWAAAESSGTSAKFPIDELSIPLCIVAAVEADCGPAPSAITIGLRGPQLLRAAVQRQHVGLTPDAALQIFELDSRTVFGVFRCNSCKDWGRSEFQTWRIADGSALTEYLAKTIVAAFEQAAAADDSAAFRQAGEALYRKLFSDGTSGQSSAERRFLAFVARNRGRSTPASIFVRLLANTEKPLFMVPLGLMSLPSVRTGSFLGLNFIIESPLELQDYSGGASCISRWVLLVPPDDPGQAAMENAREEFLKWIVVFAGRPGNAAVYEDISRFGAWIGPTTQSQPDVSTALVIVSHHDKDKLFFNSQLENPSVLSANVTRHFASPSVAIINACGTATPGAYDFVKQLNRRGVSTVIATATAVDSRMAGHFVTLLMNALHDHAGDTTYTLRRAKFDAIRALSETRADTLRPGKYGPKALIYSLIGDGSVRLCAPEAGPK